MRILVSLIALLGVIVSTGCQPNPNGTGVPSENGSSPAVIRLPDSPNQATNTPDRVEKTMPKIPERVPPTEATTPVTGEVPSELLDSILKDLAERTGAAPEKISVLQAQAIVWNDGSLGCPQPGIMYTQALVNGYWVILEVGEQKFDYRTAGTGYFTLCEGGLLPISPPGTPDS